MRKILYYILLTFILSSMVGCDNSKSESNNEKASAAPTKVVIEDNIESTDNKNENISDIFTNDETQNNLGAFYFGPATADEGAKVYEYSGKEIKIPFKVTGMDEKVTSYFGLMIFVDGLVQPYRIKMKSGETLNENNMQEFALKYNETKEFDIYFTPVVGKKGDRIGIIFSTILKPEYLPENEESPNYGSYHSLSATLPSEILFKTDTIHKSNLSVFSNFKVENIPQSIIDASKNSYITGSDQSLDANFITELLSENTEKEFFNAQNGKVKLKFRIYGGIDGAKYRTVFFINHKPIKVGGDDYLENQVKKGKMYTFEHELDISGYDKYTTIYAITNPVGKDYKTVANFPIKTKSMLIVNN